MARHFIAFPSGDAVHKDTIERAAKAASTAEVEYLAWSACDGSGSPVDQTVESWIDDSDAMVADLTYVNDNVTYELGYAIGRQKNLRLIRNHTVDVSDLKQIGLLDGLIRDQFRTRADLEGLLRGKAAPSNTWSKPSSNIRQPIYAVSPAAPTPFATKLFSAIKKRTRYKFRSFKSWEMPGSPPRKLGSRSVHRSG